MTTTQYYLKVTYRNGQPQAAYLYLPRRAEDRSVRTQRMQHGLLVDFAGDGRAIGVEITAPSQVSLEAINEVLSSLNAEPATQNNLALLAA